MKNPEIRAVPLWQARPFQPGDEKQAVPLFNRIFDQHISLAHYRWKIAATPWVENVAAAWMAEAGGKIVGQYAGTATPFWLEDRAWKIMHVCDVMTHPDFRRQGILSGLGQAANEDWAASGVLFASGVPHTGWGSRKGFLNWHPLFQAPWLWRPLQFDKLMAAREHALLAASARPLTTLDSHLTSWWSGQNPQIEIRPLTVAGAEINDLWELLKADYPAAVLRNSAWIQYRYLDVPENPYRVLLAVVEGQPAGYIAFRTRNPGNGPVGYIADLFTARGDHRCRRALITAALTQLRDMDARSVLTVAAPGAPGYTDFRRMGFFPRYGKFEMCIVPLQPDMPMALLGDPGRCFFMGGDFDMI